MTPKDETFPDESILNLFAEGLICVPGEDCAIDLTLDENDETVVLGYN